MFSRDEQRARLDELRIAAVEGRREIILFGNTANPAGGHCGRDLWVLNIFVERSGSLHRRRAGRRGHSRVPVQHTGVCFAPLHHAAHWPRHQLQCSKPLLAWPKQQSRSAEHSSGDSVPLAAAPSTFDMSASIWMLRYRLSPMDAFQACVGDRSVLVRPYGSRGGSSLAVRVQAWSGCPPIAGCRVRG